MDVCSDQSAQSSPQQQSDEQSAVRLKLPQQQQQQQQNQIQQQQQQQQQHQKQSSQQQAALLLGRQKSNDALICGANQGACEQAAASSESAAGMEPDCIMMDDLDEEQLKRILACKRLSEGCNRFSGVGAGLVCRKNSLHMLGESLAPVTEGEPMRHLPHHLSQNIESTSSSSVSSGSFRSGAGRQHLGGGGGVHMSKRSSQEDNTNSCSSSTSLDGSNAGSGGPRSPSRRRSSTVSQCSSVLSEGTRQQLNFDLSPDLAPDSSILEANAISPTDFERPASPEPSSLASADGSFELRPVSGLSQFCDDLMLASTPDSTLGDSNEGSNSGLKSPPAAVVVGVASAVIEADEAARDGQQQQQQLESNESSGASETLRKLAERERHEAAIRDNLERIISHVSTVRVSSTSTTHHQSEAPAAKADSPTTAQASATNGQKRAHTPFGANLQRNKTSLISSSPSPTARAPGLS